ncbi:hypothetical protein niasHT_017603 [Heterodera trifolii]|uniref:RING-type domain-containing protein n=1 Tax=Heterodera trifolii TaxID=157864 RepID=A0ABD2L0K9_9BILA
MEEKSWKNKQKKDKKDEKSNNSKEKQKLRLMYTAVDNLIITANIENEPDKENKMIRRKKRFDELDFCTDLVLFLMLTYIIQEINTWLLNRGYIPNRMYNYLILPDAWVENALINFHQKIVSKAVKKVINTIPVHTFEGFEGDGSGNRPNNGFTGCPICLAAYKTGEKVRTLPCNKKHQFHSECVDPWIEKQNNCPSCRAKVFNVNLINLKAELNNTGQQNQIPTATENARNLDNATSENM